MEAIADRTCSDEINLAAISELPCKLENSRVRPIQQSIAILLYAVLCLAILLLQS